MNIEQIQRINTLAVDLMKQGLAQDREEAVAQAEKIFRDKDPSYYDAITKPMEDIKREEDNRSRQGKNTTVSPISDADVQKILEQNTQFLVKTIRTFQEKMAGLEKEMASLKNELRYQKLPTVNQIVTKKEAPQSSEAESQPRGKTESSSSGHPRSGNYNAEDVSIEKFFYYGG